MSNIIFFLVACFIFTWVATDKVSAAFAVVTGLGFLAIAVEEAISNQKK